MKLPRRANNVVVVCALPPSPALAFVRLLLVLDELSSGAAAAAAPSASTAEQERDSVMTVGKLPSDAFHCDCYNSITRQVNNVMKERRRTALISTQGIPRLGDFTVDWTCSTLGAEAEGGLRRNRRLRYHLLHNNTPCLG